MMALRSGYTFVTSEKEESLTAIRHSTGEWKSATPSEQRQFRIMAITTFTGAAGTRDDAGVYLYRCSAGTYAR